MKVYQFTMLSVVGVILLTGNSFGSELRWKKSGNSAATVHSVTHIPTVITTDDGATPVITQVQQVVPVPMPPRLAPVPVAQSDHYISEYTDELRALQGQNPPTGAVTVPFAATPRNMPIVPTPPRIESGTQSRKTLPPCETNQMGLKSIRGVSHDIRPKSDDALPEECAIVSDPYYGRSFSQSCFVWKASALSTKAAYFEDAQLERHGHTKVCPALQPVVSGAKFFATVPMLPYKMGVHPPNECVYTLGHYRTGSCAPYMREPFPISPRGALFQAGAVAGIVVP